MTIITADYTPSTKFSTAASFIFNVPKERDDIGLPIPEQVDIRTLIKNIRDAMGASAFQSFKQTLSYRWVREDTLTWGNLDNWIELKWIECLLESHQSIECFSKYDKLWNILESARFHRVEEIFNFRDKSTVWHFLQNNSNLIGFLLDSYIWVIKYFGPNSLVELEVVKDPEADGFEQLFAYIITSLPVEEALRRLSLFDDEWFLDQLDLVGDIFNFNLEIK